MSSVSSAIECFRARLALKCGLICYNEKYDSGAVFDAYLIARVSISGISMARLKSSISFG